MAFVRRCRTEGLKTALVTSADAVKAEANLVELGLSRTDFDAFVTGLDVERKKPYPDIYLAGARLIAVDPADCLVIEDAVASRPRRAAGCSCLGITSSFSKAELAAAGASVFAKDLAHAVSLVFGATRAPGAAGRRAPVRRPRKTGPPPKNRRSECVRRLSPPASGAPR